MEKFEFLKSVRFWKLFAAATAEFLASQGIITTELAHAISALLASSVIVRTVDRLSEPK